MVDALNNIDGTINYSEYEKYDEMNIPGALKSIDNLEEYDKGTVTFILSHKTFNSKEILENKIGEGEFYKDLGIFIDKFYLSFYNREWLSQSIQGKTIYVMIKGNRSRMPWKPSWFRIQDSFLGLGNILNPLPEYFAKVDLAFGEKTIADLLKNSFKYHYDESSNHYIASSKEEQTKQKYLYLKKATYSKFQGYEFEEIDEIKELIAFLFQKVGPTLTKEEKNQFSEIIGRTINSNKIVNFISKNKSFEKNLDKNINKKEGI